MLTTSGFHCKSLSVTSYSNICTKKCHLYVQIKEILQHPQKDGQGVESDYFPGEVLRRGEIPEDAKGGRRAQKSE